jgi:hypothetical protein
MKRVLFFLLLVIGLISCKNSTVKLLSKKWDCVQVENLQPVDTKFQSKEDSVKAIQIEAALKELNWTFESNMEYRCGIGDRTTIRGTYALSDNDKTLTCTPETKNNINSYTIKALSENELQLTSMETAAGITLHFRPH